MMIDEGRAVGTVDIDFNNIFTTVLHGRHGRKMFAHGIYSVKI